MFRYFPYFFPLKKQPKISTLLMCKLRVVDGSSLVGHSQQGGHTFFSIPMNLNIGNWCTRIVDGIISLGGHGQEGDHSFFYI
jgi:hypothetical protein